MEKSPTEFYNDLVSEYHLMFADWRKEVQHQGSILGEFLQKHSSLPVQSILDCTCGIGTQSIGLAMQGYKVQSSDLSSNAVERANIEAKSFGVSLNAKVEDIRMLDKTWPGGFDVVLSCDNSLSHFFDNDNLLQAIQQIHKQLRAGGLLVASIRDYDQILSNPGCNRTAQQLPGEYGTSDRPQATLPRVFDDRNGRRLVFQVWDWAPDGQSYAINQFFMVSHGTSWKTSHYVSRFRALLREDLTNILTKGGFRSIQWHMPDETDFYQPLVTARA